MSLSAPGARFPAMFEPIEGCAGTTSRNCGCLSDERAVSWLLATERRVFSRSLAQRSPYGTFSEVNRSNGHARSSAMKGERRKEIVTPLQFWFTIEDNTSTKARTEVLVHSSSYGSSSGPSSMGMWPSSSTWESKSGSRNRQFFGRGLPLSMIFSIRSCQEVGLRCMMYM